MSTYKDNLWGSVRYGTTLWLQFKYQIEFRRTLQCDGCGENVCNGKIATKNKIKKHSRTRAGWQMTMEMEQWSLNHKNIKRFSIEMKLCFFPFIVQILCFQLRVEHHHSSFGIFPTSSYIFVEHKIRKIKFMYINVKCSILFKFFSFLILFFTFQLPSFTVSSLQTIPWYNEQKPKLYISYPCSYYRLYAVCCIYMYSTVSSARHPILYIPSSIQKQEPLLFKLCVLYLMFLPSSLYSIP